MRSFVIVMPVLGARSFRTTGCSSRCWWHCLCMRQHICTLPKCKKGMARGGEEIFYMGLPKERDRHSYALPSQQHENSASECTKIQTKPLSKKKTEPKKKRRKNIEENLHKNYRNISTMRYLIQKNYLYSKKIFSKCLEKI